jgi:lipid II:glycine glycyltransferase (peptidoglycan interpeptide bridge formation enzyme)
MKDIRQTKAYAQYLAQIGWSVKKMGSNYYFIKKIPILGAFIKLQRPEKIDFEALEKLQKNYRVFQIVIEPKNNSQIKELKSRGYKLSKSPYLPTKTLQINLKQSEKQIFSQFKKDARYSINKAKKLVLFTKPSIKSFHDSWKRAISWQRHLPKLAHLKALQKSFDSQSLFLASHNDQKRNKLYRTNFSAGAIFLKADNTVFYWQAFTSPLARQSLAQYCIVWHGILWGKSQGAKFFDFEGIYDKRFPNKSWLGFSHFKKSFGGKEIAYPGAYKKTLIFK